MEQWQEVTTKRKKKPNRSITNSQPKSKRNSTSPRKTDRSKKKNLRRNLDKTKAKKSLWSKRIVRIRSKKRKKMRKSLKKTKAKETGLRIPRMTSTKRRVRKLEHTNFNP